MKLLILLFLPLFAGLLLQITGKYRFSGYLAPASALISLVVTLMVISGVPSGNVSVDWMQVPGVRFNLQLDEISKIMLLLTGLLYPFILFSGWGREQTNQSSLQALLLFSQSALTGVFLAGNAFLFYVCWELALLPVFFILLLWGGPGRRSITLKFFIYTLAGSLFLLFGIIYLYLQTPGLHSADFAAMAQLQLPEKTQQWLFWILFIGLAVKMPLFPFHTWQPPAYTTAPLQGTMVLAGIMSKMGIYGVFRLLFPILPQGVLFWQNTVIILGLTGVVYASVIAFRQNNLKTLIAFSSLAHISLMVAALFAANTYAVQGVLFQVVAHGITIVALFYLVMLTEEKAGTSELSGMGGLKISAPRLALLFMLVMLGGIALPLTSGFIGEFLMITGIFKVSVWFALAGGLTLVLGAVYMLYAYQRAFLGPLNPAPEHKGDIISRDQWWLIPLVILILVLGIWPQPVLNLVLTIPELLRPLPLP